MSLNMHITIGNILFKAIVYLHLLYINLLNNAHFSLTEKQYLFCLQG